MPLNPRVLAKLRQHPTLPQIPGWPAPPPEWRRSKKGWLWTRLDDDMLVTVFRKDFRGEKPWVYCKQLGKGAAHYSKTSWATEQEAKDAAQQWILDRMNY